MNDFVNITSNDNWFKQHPEKIAGVEFKTTSIFFPIQVKGTKADVLRVTGMMNSTNKNIILAKAKMKMAIAKLKLSNSKKMKDKKQPLQKLKDELFILEDSLRINLEKLNFYRKQADESNTIKNIASVNNHNEHQNKLNKSIKLKKREILKLEQPNK